MLSQQNIWNNESLIKTLKGNGVAVIPTDTIYGIVGSALDVSAVNRIYSIRKRDPKKPCVILIGDIDELEKFSIVLSEKQKAIVQEYWSALITVGGSLPVSIVFECSDEKFAYLHRGTQTLAFRLPAEESLRDLLKETGPLIAPSANPEGLSPSENISEARKYFGNLVDLYIDGGEIKGKASKVIKLQKDGSVYILRE
ncbi:MAG: L-threonylcarbamoyladenylate synthase [Candidatus Paceibacterota bacterium]|jgi:L-threonylcarbamoyladenylate synthase